MTEQEYNDFWDSEKRWDKAILNGGFGTAITKGIEAAEREIETNILINKAVKKKSFLQKIKAIFK